MDRKEQETSAAPAGVKPSTPTTTKPSTPTTAKPSTPTSAGQTAPSTASGSPAVRFAATTEEIQPSTDIDDSLDEIPPPHKLPFDADADLKELSKTLHDTGLQNRRMSHFTFEPVSLPASRVPSNEDSSREPSRHPTHTSSGKPSPHQSPRTSAMHSPPLTPAATSSRDQGVPTAEPGVLGKGAPLKKVEAELDPSVVTPQISPPPNSVVGQNVAAKATASTKPSSQPNSRPSSMKEGTGSVRSPRFTVGPSSAAASRESSPNRNVMASSTYTRPFTPAGDLNDPYAAHKRAPQSRNLDAIDARFIFSGKSSRKGISPSASSISLPRSSRSSAEIKNGEKRSSLFGREKKDNRAHLQDDDASITSSKHGSMSDLKRFLKIGSQKKRGLSPAPSFKSGTKTPPNQKAPAQLPFGDDHGLTSKYGKFGKVLGAGAGGSVRLMKRSSDGTTFAVKEFRARHAYESEKEYAKKVTAEFCVGSTLHHGNIIETLDIINEKGKWYEVMEYAPYDLFAIVMTGKMSREEVTCSFLQILSGVTYLHSMGLAHRDLKLDNVVVNEHGIMKIIDFGSASVFKYPFENAIVLASGIVGSDPYLAPEVYDERKYDPQPADIWSLAIIFCCMSLRRFPWKMPRMTDNSYKLFASPPSPGTDMRRSHEYSHSKSTNDFDNSARENMPQSNPGSRATSPVREPTPGTGAALANKSKSMANANNAANGGEKKPEVIKGPWRLLRLLPRESRHIIGRMLEIDPRKRATMSEILDDPWVANTPICRQIESQVINVDTHTHTLEPSAGPAK